MKKVSRRELAKEITAQLLSGAKLNDLMQQLAAYLIDHKMVSQADALLNDIAVELQATTGQVSASVMSAFSLSPANLTMLKHYIAEATQARSVELAVSEDKSLLGGVIIRTAEEEYDASIRTKLNQLARGES